MILKKLIIKIIKQMNTILIKRYFNQRYDEKNMTLYVQVLNSDIDFER